MVMRMKDVITVLIYGVLIFAIFTLFFKLLPILLPIVGVMMLISYFRRKKAIENLKKEQYHQTYEDTYTSQYQTRGNIKSDVIDVEYKETVEK